MGDPASQSSSSDPTIELHGDEFWPLSGKPFFDIILAKSHVNPKCQMSIPSKLHPLLLSCSVPVVLTFGGKTWEMTCNTANNAQKFFDRPSWKAFVDDNNLKVGDGCVFELTECSSTKLVFRVQILRGEIPAQLLDKDTLVAIKFGRTLFIGGTKSKEPFFVSYRKE
ncbi:putative transcription factor B3-Domain family [Rosa chinensis]|uniref:Putative transcription factor B3-Domain family n=1 Tax=Rosa chinensis TaxID=74649 RepID=A0A2P6SDZ8_ROSCH|nr:putative transcription factor B3-Domain family [Rosa chinensis]